MLPVIDLMAGQVVRAIAGRRDTYQPIRSPLTPQSDPQFVASVFSKTFDARTVYVADLDAIQGRPANLNGLQQILATGLRVWLDAGIRSAADLETIWASLAKAGNTAADVSLILALESLPDPATVRSVLGDRDPRQFIFSLDLKDARPLTSGVWQNSAPDEIVASVYELGIRRFIVLDLAQVGVASGTGTNDLCRKLRQRFSQIELFAGGGVRGIDDLRQLHDDGCRGALVATALHDGRLTPADVAGAATW